MPFRSYELRARYYNPIMGRLISPDPMGFAGGQPNLLEYSFDAPTDYFDPLGLGCGGGDGGPAPCTSPNCLPGLCEGAADCPNAPIGRHGGGHSKQPPIHPKAPAPVSITPFAGEATLLATGADSIKLALFLVAASRSPLQPFKSASFGTRYAQALPGVPMSPEFEGISFPAASEPVEFLQPVTP